MARTYAVAEAKAKLSEILRIVKSGRSVTISDRGSAVARVVPVAVAASIEERLGSLAERGNLVEPRAGAPCFPTVARIPGALERFLEDRD